MKTLSIVLGILLLVSCWVWMGVNRYFIERDTISWQERSMIASDTEDMVVYLDNLMEGMKKHRATEGNAGLIFKKPYLDAALDYRAINALRKRADNAKILNKNEVVYQTLLDDIRGCLRDLEIEPVALWINRNIVLIWILHLLSLFSFIVRLSLEQIK